MVKQITRKVSNLSPELLARLNSLSLDSTGATLLGETHAVDERSEACRQAETSARFHPLRERVEALAEELLDFTSVGDLDNCLDR